MFSALAAVPVLAHAQTSTFTFDGGSLVLNDTIGNISTYMTGIAGQSGGIGGTVTVTGGTVTSGPSAGGYAGEGYVVGPRSGTSRNYTVTPITLGNTNNYSGTGVPTLNASPDKFLINLNGASGVGPSGAATSDRITMDFTNKIYSVQFDYEIFPDGTGQTPDFTLYAGNGGASNTLVFSKNGGSPSGSFNTTYTHSNNNKTGTESSLQYIGASDTYTFANGVSELQFVDWPATIGIDNLVLCGANGCGGGGGGGGGGTPVPEPATLALLGVGLAGLGVARRRR